MKSSFCRISAALVLLFVLFIIPSCGDTTTSDYVTTQNEADAGHFYPFDTPPVLISFAQPEYPGEADRAGLEGEVAVRVLVGIDGTVEQATVVESSDPMFETSALDAASRCMFTPAKLGGKPTKSMVMIPFQFRSGQ